MVEPRMRVIAGIEVLSGAYATIGALLAWPSLGFLAGWPAAILVAAGSLTCVAGFWLWNGEQRGVRLSRRIQIIQAVQLAVPGFAFACVVGPTATIGWPAGSDFALGAAFAPEVRIAVWHHSLPFRFQLNVFAVVLLLLLQKYRPGPEAHGARSEVAAA
jgi:hypothetical protein